MQRPHNAFLSIALLGMLALFSGCGRGGWKAAIVDAESGAPIRGACVTIWGYGQEPWADDSPDEAAKPREKGKWKDGFSFISDENGIVCCRGVYTRGDSEPERRTDPQPERNPTPPDNHNHGSDQSHDRRDRPQDQDDGRARRRFIPAAGVGWVSCDDTHVCKGRWLAISITAMGYQPYRFFFQPDAPEGDFGTIKLKKVAADDGK